MKKQFPIFTLLLLSMAAAVPAIAADFSGSLTATSDYVFRGISQNDENPALQAGIKMVFDGGFYLSTWGSNADFGNTLGSDAELDLVAGWSGDLATDWNLDINLTRYTYPGTRDSYDLDYNELIGTFTWRGNYWAQLGWSNDVFASGQSGTYLQAGTKFSLADAFRLEAMAGYYALDDACDQSYSHAQLNAIYSIGKLDLRASAHLTDDDAEDIFGSRLASSRLELTASYSF